MPYIDEGVINYLIFEDGNEYYGTASLSLPELNHKTITVNGAGIAGDYTAPILGQIESMTLGINWRNTSRQVTKLSEMRDHRLDIYVAQQLKYSGTPDVSVDSDKYVVIGRPQNLSIGQVQPASEMGTGMQLSLTYFAYYKNRIKKIEVDPLNFIYIVDGVDYLADVRRALGKA